MREVLIIGSLITVASAGAYVASVDEKETKLEIRQAEHKAQVLEEKAQAAFDRAEQGIAARQSR